MALGSRDSPPVRARNPRGEGGRLRDELVGAARTLLAEANAESDVSIRKVTRAVGVTPQAFYLQFATLDDLLFAVYAAEFAELLAALAASRSDLPPGDAALRAMCSAYVRFALERPMQYRLMMSTRGTVHEDWDPANLPGAPVLALLRESVAAAATGSAAPAVHAAVVQLWATLHGIVTLRESRPTFPWPPIEEMVRRAVDAAVSSATRAPQAQAR